MIDTGGPIITAIPRIHTAHGPHSAYAPFHFEFEDIFFPLTFLNHEERNVSHPADNSFPFQFEIPNNPNLETSLTSDLLGGLYRGVRYPCQATFFGPYWNADGIHISASPDVVRSTVS